MNPVTYLLLLGHHMSDVKTTPKAPDQPPADEPRQRGRLVRNPFAVALSDACEVFDPLPAAQRQLLLDNLQSLYGPTPAQLTDQAR